LTLPTPNYWMHETSGVLAPVVEAYIRGEELAPQDIAIMRAYLRQWIKSPVWMDVTELRESVEKITTREDIDVWLKKAEDAGIDPL
jgi:hypothetical protein